MFNAQYDGAFAFDVSGDSLVGYLHYAQTGSWYPIDFREYSEFYTLIDNYGEVTEYLYEYYDGWDVFCGFGLTDNVSNVEFTSFVGYNSSSFYSESETAFIASLSNSCSYYDEDGKTEQVVSQFNTTTVGNYHEVTSTRVRSNISIEGSVSMVTRGSIIWVTEGQTIINENGSNDIFKNSMDAITKVLQVQVWENMTLGTVVFVPVLMGLVAFFVKSFKA